MADVTASSRVLTPTLMSGDDIRLRLLSFNIHVGLDSRHPIHYLTNAWRHALPGPGSRAHLDRIAEVMQGYDFVAVQEADAGSLRTRQVNLLEYLAKRAGYSYWGHSITRNLPPFARHSLGYLSRFEPNNVVEHVLPSSIPGRRAVTLNLGPTAGGLHLMVTHLSLGRGSRQRQLDFLSARVPAGGPVVLLGDLNCEPEILRRHEGLKRSGLWLPDSNPATFPSWKPRQRLDHVLVTPHVDIHRVEALTDVLSDHLPLAIDIGIRSR
ncbi:MAG: endonuclease/exonuclease/phosphatase family protein [Pseudomonadota bacterium]